MGLIKIQTCGSFRDDKVDFSAIKHGHARAISDAIKYLNDRLPEAIRQDHDLQDNGQYPERHFGKD
jgi:hypothetical protein